MFRRVLVALALVGAFGLGMLVAQGPGFSLAAQADSRYFPETKHTVHGGFLKYWTDHGGLAQQGYPLTEEFQEKSSLDGKTYTVQYFERAVFELHPENAGTPFEILLTQLGKYQLDGRYPNNSNPAAVPVQPPAASAPPTQPPAPPAATAVPTQAASLSDQQWATQVLRPAHAKLPNGHVLQLVDVTALTSTSSGVGTVYNVIFDVNADEYSDLATNGAKAQLDGWVRSVLTDLKTHWPGKTVYAEMEWQYYSESINLSNDCHYLGDYDATENGFFQTDTVVGGAYLAASKQTQVNICVGK